MVIISLSLPVKLTRIVAYIMSTKVPFLTILLIFLLGPYHRPHSFIIQRFIFDQIYNIELDLLFEFVCDGKIVPLCSSFSLSVVLNQKIVFLVANFYSFC